jgi:MFS family permease
LTLDSAVDMETSNAYPHYRRNFVAVLADYTFFAVAMAFINPSTILPAFLRQLTDSPLLIGLNGTLQTGVWLLPQLIAANYLDGKAQKKRYLLIPAAAGRPVFFVLTLCLSLGAVRFPAWTLAVFFFGMTLFWLTDALATVAWFDIVGQVFPGNRRGRLFGLAQVLSGLMTVGVGFGINIVLGSTGPPFPHNYAILFLAAGALLACSWFSMATIKETSAAVKTGDALPQTTFLRRLGRIWQRDRNFRLFIAVRLLAGLSDLAIPFYVIFAADRLGLGQGVVGSFTSAQVVGRMAGGVILGALHERRGGRWAIQAGMAAGVLAPLWALLLPLWLPAGHPYVAYGYSLVFAALGMLQSTFIQGFFNYLLDMAPADERATYIALSNTISGVVLWPTALVGGVILKVTGNSYNTLFAITAAGLGLGLVCSAWLAER